jgi:hypothetical protein
VNDEDRPRFGSATAKDGGEAARRLDTTQKGRNPQVGCHAHDMATAVWLVVPFQYLHPICIGLKASFGNKRTTGEFVILVEFSNSTFNLEINVKLESNVKFIPLDWINCPNKNHLPLTDTCFGFAFAAVAEGSRG